jgi:hypothetical protein
MKKSELASLGKSLKERSAPEWVLSELRSVFLSTKGDEVSLEHEALVTKLVDTFKDSEESSPGQILDGDEEIDKDSLVDDSSEKGATIHLINNIMQDIVKNGDKTLPAKIFKRHAEPGKNLQSQSKTALLLILEDLKKARMNLEEKHGRSK